MKNPDGSVTLATTGRTGPAPGKGTPQNRAPLAKAASQGSKVVRVPGQGPVPKDTGKDGGSAPAGGGKTTKTGSPSAAAKGH